MYSSLLRRTSPAAVDAFLRRCGLQGEQWVRLEAAEARGGGGGGAAEGPVVVASVRALVQVGWSSDLWGAYVGGHRYEG